MFFFILIVERNEIMIGNITLNREFHTVHIYQITYDYILRCKYITTYYKRTLTHRCISSPSVFRVLCSKQLMFKELLTVIIYATII
jgi:hypothetical protein